MGKQHDPRKIPHNTRIYKEKDDRKNPAVFQKEVMKTKTNEIVLNNVGATNRRHCYYNIPLLKFNPKFTQ